MPLSPIRFHASIHFHLQFLLIYIVYPLSLNLSFSIAQSAAKLPQAATSLVFHLLGVTQNFIHFFHNSSSNWSGKKSTLCKDYKYRLINENASYLKFFLLNKLGRRHSSSEMLLKPIVLKALRLTIHTPCLLKIYPYRYDRKSNRLLPANKTTNAIHNVHVILLMLQTVSSCSRLIWSLSLKDPPPLGLNILTISFCAAYRCLEIFQFYANRDGVMTFMNCLLARMEKISISPTTEQG